MRELALFAGGGGGILGGKLLGWRTVCAVEIDAWCRSRLLQRQREGILPRFNIWDDVRTFDGRPWRGNVDIVTGGFPCQQISVAGNGEGLEGEDSGLWREQARIIGEVGPQYVLVENSPALTVRGLGVVLGDLASLGYDAKWGVLGAADAIWSFGDPCVDHERNRIWIVASATHSEGERRGERRAWRPDSSSERQFEQTLRTSSNSKEGRQRAARHGAEGHVEAAGYGEPASGFHPAGADSDMSGLGEQRRGVTNEEEFTTAQCGGWWGTEPTVGRVAHGVANRVDRLRAIGNGQVPAVVQLAWRILGA